MKPTYMKNGQSLELRSETCVGCGACVEVCPHAVFRVAAGKASIVGREYCMECGACALNCPTGALSVRPGVGCAAAIIIGKLRGSTPTCGGDSCGKPREGAEGVCC